MKVKVFAPEETVEFEGTVEQVIEFTLQQEKLWQEMEELRRAYRTFFSKMDGEAMIRGPECWECANNSCRKYNRATRGTIDQVCRLAQHQDSLRRLPSALSQAFHKKITGEQDTMTCTAHNAT